MTGLVRSAKGVLALRRALLLLGLLASQTAVFALPVARLKNVRAPVEVRAADARVYRAARERTTLSYGDMVRAGATGKADILFNNGTQIALRPGAQIEIVRPERNNPSLIIRLFGALSEIFVRPKGPTEIRTRAANAAARGTEYLVRLPSEDTTVVTVTEGSVDFYNEQGKVLVQAEQQSTAQVGKPPTPPVAVDVTGLVAWTVDIIGLPVAFETPFRTSDPAAARVLLPALEAAARAAPDGAAVHLQLGGMYYDAGEYSAAEVEFAAAARLAPDEAAALFGLGQARRGQTDAAGAIAAYRQALEKAPQFAPARYGMALAQLARGNAEDARATLQPLADEAMAQAIMGLLELRAGRNDAATQQLEAALAAQPDLYQARALLALARLGENDLPAALASARRAVQLQPRSAQTQGVLAMVEFFAGHTTEAGRSARLAVEINPFSPFALLTQGRVLLSQLKTDEARDVLQRAQALAPELPVIERELGTAYLRLDMPKKAEAVLRHALALDPQSSVTLTALGVALQRQGRIEEALATQREALQLAPDNVSARANLAALLIEADRLDEASEQLDRAVAIEPERGILYTRLSEISLLHQDLPAAQRYARRAVQLLPGSAPAQYQLGRVYLEQGRIVQAEERFRLAVTLDRRFAKARYALGYAQELEQTTRDVTSRPSAVTNPSNVDAAAAALDLQNLQTPGANQRIQAALQDPTVARSASRAYGDFQLDAAVGTNDARDGRFSYLHETDDRRGLYGVHAEYNKNGGALPNSDTIQNRLGLLYGRKAGDNPSGVFALATYERINEGLNQGNFSPFASNARERVRKPMLLIGGNWQSSERRQTRALLQFIRPETEGTGYLNNSYLTQEASSLNAEVRHDMRWGERHVLSIGATAGTMRRESDNFFGAIPGVTLPRYFRGETEQNLFGAYVRDEMEVNERTTVIGELRVLQTEIEQTSLTFLPVPIPSSTSTLVDTARVLPSFIAIYRPNAHSGVRLRARKLLGTPRHLRLLAPDDVFLFDLEELPQLSLTGGAGRSLELEYDHTFRDTSLLRLGLFAQRLSNAQEPSATNSGSNLPEVRLRGLRAGYEGVLGPNTTFFIRFNLNDVEDRLLNQDVAFVPRLSGEAGLLYLNRQGWFVQPSAYYQGTYFNADDPRVRKSGFGLFNLRVGKRSGTRSVVFMELTNMLDKDYEVLGVSQPGRQFRLGATQRF